MTNTTKAAIAFGVVAGIFGVAAFFGFTPFLKVVNNVEQFASATPTGGTFTSVKQAAISFTPATAAATSTSILNPFGQDVYVTDNFIGCENATTSYTAVSGGGLASFKIFAATTSNAAPAVISNTNLVMNDTVATGTVAAGLASDFGGVALVASSSIATTSALGFSASLTNGNAGARAYQFLWAVGTNLTFWSNATNTAQCTIGVHVFSA